MEFELNLKRARRTILLFISSSLILVFLIVTTDNKISDRTSEFIVFYILFILFYFCLLLFLCRRLFLSYFVKPKILINENEILIPNYYLGLKRIVLSDIYSLEYNFYTKSNVLVLGLKNQSGYILDNFIFLNEKDFYKFKDKVEEIVAANENDKLSHVVQRVASIKETQSAFFTYLISLVCVGMFFLGTSGGLEYPEEYTFVFMGGGSKLLFNENEFYRIFSSPFIHGSIFHLGINIFVIGMIGELLEKLISPIRFLNIILCSAFVAFFSFWMFSSFEYGAGLSGGIFGVFGAYVALRIRYEKYLPGSLSMLPLSKLMAVIGVEIIFEILVLDNIDQYAHLGGFVAGFLYLYFLPLGEKLEKVNKPFVLEKCLFVCLALSYSVGLSSFLIHYY